MKLARIITLTLLAGTAVPALAQDEVVSENGNVIAARVTVSPLRFEMDGAQRSETLRVINPSTRPVGVQVRAFAWDQVDGKDVYTPTTEVTVSPAIIVIEPGVTQIFRVARRELPPQGERRYRIAIDQLPDPELEGNGRTVTRVRMTLPVFIDRASAAPAVLAWSIKGNTLNVANSGQQTARMVNLSLTNAAGELPIEGASLHYVQGGSRLSWTLPQGCPSGLTTITVRIDGETVNAPVPVDCS